MIKKKNIYAVHSGHAELEPGRHGRGAGVRAERRLDQSLGGLRQAEEVLVLLSSRSRHTRFSRDWSSDVCSSDLDPEPDRLAHDAGHPRHHAPGPGLDL